MQKMKREVCVGSLEAARLVSELSIDRIETCVALEQGGLTPSRGMVNWIDQTFDLEQHVLIRQRPGGFCYNYDEIVVMRDQILDLKNSGAKGFVVGALMSDGSLDSKALETWKRTAEGYDFTFHRAFDEVADWKVAMDELIRMGFKRILTSGLANSVGEGLTNFAELVNYANGRIEIMAGGGLKPEQIVELAKAGVDAVHFSGTVLSTISSGSAFSAEILAPNLDRLKTFVSASE